jgi:hypothetical protein
MSDQSIRNKSVDVRSEKRIASFEPRERTMEIQNNHQLTVCMKGKLRLILENFQLNRMVRMNWIKWHQKI